MCSWKRLDVDENKEYYVALCQNPDGYRAYELCEVGSEPKSEYVVFRTGVVPCELLWWKRFEEISTTVMLTNGQQFFVDAHGVWLTKEEIEALMSRTERHQIPWLNGIAPIFPPR